MESPAEADNTMARDHDADKEDPAVNGELPAIAEEGQEQPQVVTTYMVVPPDGGWGWVVAGASFLSNLIVDGIIFSFGMYMGEMSESLGESKATVSLIGSLLAGFYLVVGPFVSALANRYGFRTVAVLGSFVGAFSFFISYFATSAVFLCITYGVLGGVGFGLIYVPAVITVGFYFERWRALATGVAVCGSGIGTFVMPPIITALIGAFGWRGSLLILAGLVLNCAIFGLMYRPLKPQKVTVENKDGGEETPKDEQGAGKPGEQLPLLVRIKMARDDQLHKSTSIGSFADNVSVTAEKPFSQNRLLKANNNNTYPTAAEALAGSVVHLNGSRHVSSQSLNLLGGGGLAKNTATSGSITLTKAQKRLSAPTYPDNYLVPPAITDISSGNKDSTEVTEMLLPLTEENHNSHYNASDIKKEALQKRNSRTRTISECSRTSLRSRKGLGTSRDNVGVRPLYRDDIFFGGSLQRLPQYTSQISSVGYHMSVSRLPTKADVEQERKNQCMLCPEAVQRILATMLDMSLLRSPTFLLLSLSGFITMMGFYIPFMFITDRAEKYGLDKNLAVFLVSVIGITNTVGRVGCGILTSFPGVDSLLINNVALTIGGIATMFSGIDTSAGYQFFYASVFGLAMACFASLRSIVIVDLLGLDKLTNAFGLLLLFQGIAAVIGSPLAGSFMEATGSYDASFYLSGGLILVSAIIIYPLNRVNRWEKARAKSKTELIL
ncbi:hypothetical protein R5R35_002983 [Gryllus longicercus]|uniref:Major facilitator superfamily (MFS) profile domain-containing protein n=1 Tax=Gryllus longicercus TaxID=2509291 RepID=A0AAN9VPT6_9ORTH